MVRSILPILCLLAASWTCPAQQRAPLDAIFAVPSVEFDADQLAEVDAIRARYLPKLMELQRGRRELITQPQQRAWQAAYQAARKTGKSEAAARDAAADAAGLSDPQKQELARIEAAREAIIKQVRSETLGLLTDRQRALNRREQPRGRRAEKPQAGRQRTSPTHPNVRYGPASRNLIDVWLAESKEPAPMLVSIHGGGFRGGNKGVESGLLDACLQSGISVAAITYTLSDEAIAPRQFQDAARAIQFIRHNASTWNVDPPRLAATGGSAGAGLSLWLGFHDDLAEPESDDPVRHHSTRLRCMAVYNGQTTYDPRSIRKLFPQTDTYRHTALEQLFGVDLSKLDSLPEEKYRLFEEVSAMPQASRDDPPVLLMYGQGFETEITNPGIGIHHPRFGKALKEKLDALGVPCEVETNVSRGGRQYTELVMEFLRQHLLK